MKKYLIILLSIVTVLSMVSFAAPAIADTAVATEEIYEISGSASCDAELEADNIVKPGINTLTGTADRYTFENSYTEQGVKEGTTYRHKIKFSDGVTFQLTAASENMAFTLDENSAVKTKILNIANLEDENLGTLSKMSGKAIKYNGAVQGLVDGSVYMYLNNEVLIPLGTRFVVVADTYTAKKQSPQFHQKNSGGTYDKMIINVGENTSMIEGDFNKASGVAFYIPQKVSNAMVFYMDNLGVYPMYKITYYGLDGETVIDTKWALLDEEGNLLSSYTVDASLIPEGASAFTTEKGSLDKVVLKVPLENKDINLYAINDERLTLVNGEDFEKLNVSDDGYTVGTAFKGEEIENLLLWLDDDGNKYYAGDKITADKAKTLILTAFIQDATKPAMGFAYEGTADGNNNIKRIQTQFYKGVGNTVDEGRTVYHINGQGAKIGEASRFHINVTDGTDTREYTVFETVFKVVSGENNSTYSIDNSTAKPTSAMMRFYYMPIPGQYAINYGDVYPSHWPATNFNKWSPLMFIPNSGVSYEYTMGKYSKIVIDAEKSDWYEYGGDTIPFGFVDNINMGICLEVFRSTDYADIYYDYVRLYRKGVLDVTYDFNAPAGATVKGGVAKETGRGAGTGYILSTDYPEIEGYTFVGWATDKNATASQVVQTIDLTRDTTMYAVWVDNSKPVSYNTNSIRTEDPSGIRFMASVSNEIRNDESTTEYGFIVTRESLLLGNDANCLTFDNEYGIKYAYGQNYSTEKNIDKIFDNDAYNTYFTAVIYNIPENKASYSENLVVRPYLKYNGEIVYGAPMSRSIVDVAKSLRDAGYANLDDAQIAYVEKILTVCEEPLA